MCVSDWETVQLKFTIGYSFVGEKYKNKSKDNSRRPPSISRLIVFLSLLSSFATKLTENDR